MDLNVIAGTARENVQRLVMRCVTGFLVEEAYNLAIFAEGDVVDGLIFIAISQRHKKQGGVSANGLSSALDVPYETVRRKVLLLVDAGIVERDETGLLVRASRQSGKHVERCEKTYQRFISTAVKLKDLGFAPELFLQQTARAVFDLEASASIIDSLLLRTVERASIDYGSIVKALIFASIMYNNSLSLTYDPILAWRYSAAGAPPPDNLRRHVTVSETARTLRLPLETVRRQVKQMVELQFLERGRGGFLTSRAALDRPEVLAGARATILAFEQVLRDLSKAGCDLSTI